VKNCEEYLDIVRNFSQFAAEILVKYGKWFFKDGISPRDFMLSCFSPEG